MVSGKTVFWNCFCSATNHPHPTNHAPAVTGSPAPQLRPHAPTRPGWRVVEREGKRKILILVLEGPFLMITKGGATV